MSFSGRSADPNKKETKSHAPMKQKKFYSSSKVEGPFDVAIIGSGASGLTAAAMLSEAGKRVIVLERHYQPGGYTHTFTRKNYEWDVGVHYIGRASKTSGWLDVLAGLTGNTIEMTPFEGLVDEIHFPGFQIGVPNRYASYEQTLVDAFPEEREGIGSYFDEIRYVRENLKLYYGMNLLPKPLTRLARSTFVRKIHELATLTTDEVMARHIKDDRLKSVLDAQWGNIGAPRQFCSFLVHASMMGNYLESGVEYPRGGASVFARELGRTIYKNGSVIRTGAAVDSLIVRNGRVEGVALESGEELPASTVISSSGAFNTYYRLLSDQPACASIVEELRSMKPAYEYLNLFMGFKSSPTEFGLGNGNTWIHSKWSDSNTEPTWDVTDLDTHPRPQVIFFSSSCLRDPDASTRKHNGFNGQIVTAAKYGAFDEWKDSDFNKRGDAYNGFKKKITDALVGALDEKYPGIKDNVDYSELGTTLTYKHFCGSYNGIPYGLAPVPKRYASLSLRPQTPVKNLYICGQDLIMPGVPAAVGSANLCCSLILRRNVGSHWAKVGRKLRNGTGPS